MNDTERGFRRIFWGLFLVVLDFRINGFDILPDFLGFVLIAMGLGLLVLLDRRFLTARVLAVLLIVLSLATLLQHTDAAKAEAWPAGWVVGVAAQGGAPADGLVVLVIGLAVLALVVTFLRMGGLMLRAARAFGAETEAPPPLSGE
jgi:hypothetical protein